MALRSPLVLAAALASALAHAGCAGCENTVCCALPGHALARVLRPSQCTAMGGSSAMPAACDVVCCEAEGGAHAPGSRATCTRVVDPFLCDADAGASDGG